MDEFLNHSWSYLADFYRFPASSFLSEALTRENSSVLAPALHGQDSDMALCNSVWKLIGSNLLFPCKEL